MKNYDFDWQINEFMIYCRSTQLRERTMYSYEQTLRLFERWCSDELKIYSVDKVTENVIRRYISDLQERGKYTFFSSEKDFLNAVQITDIGMQRVWICYTAFTNDQNLKISCKYSKLGFESGNSYSSESYSKACLNYLPNYYSSNYIEDVYIGGSLKAVSTFLVPYAEFGTGDIITVQPYGIPSEETLTILSEDVQFFDSTEELAQAIDLEGYAEIMALHEPADEQTSAKVKAEINGYYWSFYVNSTSYEIEFWAPNKFEVRVKALGVTNGGTYTIQKGYIVCTYDSNGAIIEIPYSFGTNGIDIDVTGAFDVRS